MTKLFWQLLACVAVYGIAICSHMACNDMASRAESTLAASIWWCVAFCHTAIMCLTPFWAFGLIAQAIDDAKESRWRRENAAKLATLNGHHHDTPSHYVIRSRT